VTHSNGISCLLGTCYVAEAQFFAAEYSIFTAPSPQRRRS
jgi:hypothetical protein